MTTTAQQFPPATLLSNTGGGGRHYFFTYDPAVGNSVGKISPGIDTRGDGGYVVAPPSTHKSGRKYQWETMNLIEHAPSWISSKLRQENPTIAPPIPDKIPQGERDSTLASLAGSARRRGATPNDILALLRETNHRCAPPLLDEDLQRIANSVGKYPAATTKSAPVETVPAWKPFPTASLPEPVTTFIRAAAAALGCDEAYIALPLLAAIASAIGNSRSIQLKSSWQEPSILWAALIADSGTLKSPAIAAALEFSWKRQKQLLEQFRQEYAVYEVELERWRNTPKAERIGEQPKPPPSCQHIVCSDITVEALADRLEKTLRGVLVAIDELSGWFGSFGQYKSGKGGDVPNYLTMHRAGALKVDRKQGDQTTLYVPRAAVCIIGGIHQASAMPRATGHQSPLSPP